MFRAFGAPPASINFNEVYAALPTKIVDAQENPLAIISVAKLYEVRNTVAITNHIWDGFWFLANGPAWNALPEDVQAMVATDINDAGLKERDDVAKLNATLARGSRSQGLEIQPTRAGAVRMRFGPRASTPSGKRSTATRPGRSLKEP